MAKEVEQALSSPDQTQEADKSKSLFSDSHETESSGLCFLSEFTSYHSYLEADLPETLPSSTPLIPEQPLCNNQPAPDLESFKAEMRALVKQLEGKLAAVTENDLASHQKEIQDLKNEATVLEKVLIDLY